MDANSITRSLNLLRRVVASSSGLDSNDYGKCPYHDDKNASLHIFVAKSGRARFYCFVCNAGGDIFNYLADVNKIDFREALVKLNHLVGESPPPLSLPPEHQRDKEQIGTSPFCERDCPKYAAFREDYEILLTENHQLREQLGLGEFQPSNERTPLKH